MLETHIKDKIGGINKIWKVTASRAAANCKNYIRDIVDNLDLEPNPEKSVIALSIGDPTVYGNLGPSKETIEAVIEVLHGGEYNGYAPCVGHEKSRQAVADYLSHDGAYFQASDIILCSGCSSAIDICFTVLADPTKGHNILTPKPGFPIYKTLAESLGVAIKTYNLLPENGWKVDLRHLESRIDNDTAAIVINNPSNPCGSVYDEQHLRDILEIAFKYKVPVIADEIYEQLVFKENSFISTAALGCDVPILICGGLAKRFLVPGWRLGWIAIHDTVGAFEPSIRKGLSCLSQRIIGSNTVVQGALPTIINDTPQSFHDSLIRTLYENAKTVFDLLDSVQGLSPYMPEGTMYMMVKIHIDHFPNFQSGLDFMKKLMVEESIFCLPGECFDIPGFLRIVITVPSELLQEACSRMADFCGRYYT